MLDPDAPAGVRLEAATKRHRLIGKAAERIEVVEEIPQHQQMMAQIRRTPEGRAAVRELMRQMREAAKPAIDVTSNAKAPEKRNDLHTPSNELGHNRTGGVLDKTQAEMKECLDELRALTKQAIRSRSRSGAV